MNRDRSLLRAADTVRTGYVATMAKLEMGWFYATCDTPEEAKAAYDEFTLAYAEANR